MIPVNGYSDFSLVPEKPHSKSMQNYVYVSSSYYLLVGLTFRPTGTRGVKLHYFIGDFNCPVKNEHFNDTEDIRAENFLFVEGALWPSVFLAKSCPVHS